MCWCTTVHRAALSTKAQCCTDMFSLKNHRKHKQQCTFARRWHDCSTWSWIRSLDWIYSLCSDRSGLAAGNRTVPYSFSSFDRLCTMRATSAAALALLFAVLSAACVPAGTPFPTPATDHPAQHTFSGARLVGWGNRPRRRWQEATRHDSFVDHIQAASGLACAVRAPSVRLCAPSSRLSQDI